ncbi:MAG: insulinase family protein [Bacilli bacterium]|nr:insulinase family protein [Bacilli bacterium]
MKKTKLKGLDLEIFEETLANGLKVILLPYENKKNYFISYATKFGSTITEFKPVDSKRNIKVPTGIAHFLEHKMFEQENGEDPFTFFSKSGTGANASTSFDNTQYICYGTKNFNENLNYLLNFVNSPYFTAQNVEKEKGIIIEELKMYLDIPDFKLENKLRENLYQKNSRRIDIGGTIEDVEQITKEDLYNCYNNFYAPNNMFIIIGGKFNIEEALEVIKESVSSKEKVKLPKVKDIKEPLKVTKKEESFEADINIAKLAYGVKVPINDISITNKVELDLYLSMLVALVFGSSSEFRERMRNKKLINSLYTQKETIPDYKVFYILASSEDIDLLLKEIKHEFENFTLDQESFERMKKVWIANEVRMTDSVDSYISNLYDDIIGYDKVITNRIDLIRKMKFSKLQKLVKELDFSNYSIVKMVPKEK